MVLETSCRKRRRSGSGWRRPGRGSDRHSSRLGPRRRCGDHRVPVFPGRELTSPVSRRKPRVATWTTVPANPSIGHHQVAAPARISSGCTGARRRPHRIESSSSVRGPDELRAGPPSRWWCSRPASPERRPPERREHLGIARPAVTSTVTRWSSSLPVTTPLNSTRAPCRRRGPPPRGKLTPNRSRARIGGPFGQERAASAIVSMPCAITFAAHRLGDPLRSSG